jgi:GAF domain-containing protein
MLNQHQAALRLAKVEIEQRNRSMIALTTFAYQASSVANLRSLLNLALIQALGITGAAAGAIVLIDPETKELKLGVQKGLTPGFANILTGRQLSQEAATLMPHLASGSGALLEYRTAADEAERRLLATGNLTSLASMPLQAGPRLMGALLVGLQGERCFKAAELSFIMALSQETAVALENLNLREGLWRTFETLLGNDPTGVELQELDPTRLNSDIPTPFELSLSPPQIPLPQDDLEQLLAAMMEAEDEVQQQNIDLQALNAIAEMVNHTLDLRETLQFAVEQTQYLLSSDAAWLYLLNECDKLELRAHVGLSPTYVRGMQSLRLDNSVEGQVAAKNKAYFIKTILEDSYSHKIWVDKEGLHALAVVPIIRPERPSQSGPSNLQVIGVLAAGRRITQPYSWSPREMRLLGSVANQIAPAIDNARLYAQIQEDQASLRVGNEILRSVNDMLIEKNAFLEGFIEDDLKPALTKAAQLLEYLQDENSPNLLKTYKKDVAALQGIIERLNELAQEMHAVNKVLDKEFDKVLGQERDEKGYVGPKKPVRLVKRET